MLNANMHRISRKETKKYTMKVAFNHVLDMWEIGHFSASI